MDDIAPGSKQIDSFDCIHNQSDNRLTIKLPCWKQTVSHLIGWNNNFFNEIIINEGDKQNETKVTSKMEYSE